MEKEDFSKIRSYLGKTQKQMAQLLGVSGRAIESFEQGWRGVPPHIERQLLFLIAHVNSRGKKQRACWAILKCPIEVRRRCPAWEFQMGQLCWFINGTICHGEPQENWKKKMESCRECEVFRAMLPDLNT